jgi:hypothetical protein
MDDDEGYGSTKKEDVKRSKSRSRGMDEMKAQVMPDRSKSKGREAEAKKGNDKAGKKGAEKSKKGKKSKMVDSEEEEEVCRVSVIL